MGGPFHQGYGENRKRRVELARSFFFIEKRLNHSKDMLDSHLRYRAQEDIYFQLSSFNSHSNLVIVLKPNLEQGESLPKGYESSRKDCNNHIIFALPHERDAIDACKEFNDEARQLIQNLIDILKDKVPSEWTRGKDPEPEPEEYVQSFYYSIESALHSMYKSSKVDYPRTSQIECRRPRRIPGKKNPLVPEDRTR